MSIRTFRGELIAPGFAVGALHLHVSGSRIRCGFLTQGEPHHEARRFQSQVDILEQEIGNAVERLESESLHAEAQIMRTHMMMLRDPELHRQVLKLIHDNRHQAETAVEQVIESMATMLASSEAPVLAERSNDLRDLAMRLAVGLSGPDDSDPVMDLSYQQADCVLLLPELMPSIVLEARERGVSGFVVENGTGVSHGAILAKSFGIPVVRVARIAPIAEFAGRNGLVGGDGEVLIDPTESELTKWRPCKKTILVTRMAGGAPLRVWISIVDPDQLSTVDWDGIEGVGLYRSESLFMQYRDDFPSEQQQFVAYHRLFELAGHRPVVFRTLDLGADKPVEHMRFGPQDNPCLGLRAHRLYRYHPEIFITQIRAVLRAAKGTHRLRLMYPMIESIEQLRFVKGLVECAVQSLLDEGLPFQRDFLQGVLVETPSAAWSFERLLKEADFASVGTNDLVQYLFAVERNAANVADYYQPEHPVVLQILQSLSRQAAAAGKPLSVCGEMAANQSMLPLLAGLGITNVSVAAGMSNEVLYTRASLEEARCEQLAEQCLKSDTVEDVRTLLGGGTTDHGKAPSMGEGEAVDPVCGMTVHIYDTPYVMRAEDVTYYFCSRSCLNRFMSDSYPESRT